MVKLEVGFIRLVMFGVTISAIPLIDQKLGTQLSRANENPSFGRNNQTPALELDVFFQKHKDDNTFDYEQKLKAPNGSRFGKTFLVNQNDPRRQNFFIQDESGLKLKFEVNFSEEQLQSTNQFLTSAKLTEDYARFPAWAILVSMFG